MSRRCGPLLRLYTFLLERRALAPRGACVVAAADGSGALHAVTRLVSCCLRCETCFDRTVRIAGANRAVASRGLRTRQPAGVQYARCRRPAAPEWRRPPQALGMCLPRGCSSWCVRALPQRAAAASRGAESCAACTGRDLGVFPHPDAALVRHVDA